MPPAITCPVKCRAHHRLSPRPPPPPAPEPLARCRSPPGLAFALAAEPGARCRSPPPVAGDGGLATTAALLAGGQSRHGIFHEKLVKKAFFTAEAAHCGQMRASGYPYLQHCVETAALLSEIGAGPAVVAAGLLHDTVDDACLDYGFISEQFGADLADLVEGLSHLSKLARRNGTARRTDEADRLHTIFLAMEDAGAVLIKLADRLDNMRTLDSLPKIKQQGFAKETLEIFTPLANRLGILSWKEQLENLCFKYLYPEHFEELSSDLLEFYNRDMIAAAIRRLEQALQVRGLSYHAISGRHKSLCNIYSKMVRKKLAMDEIYDIHGVRVILGNKVDCFTALEVVHRLWPRLPGKFKDYISSPKPNGYQSLHTVILSEDTLPLEIQIRTRDMHLRAEFGIAAYWIYKEGNYLSKNSLFVPQMVEWVRWVVTWQCETMHIDCPLSLRRDPPGRATTCSFPSHSDDCPLS